MPKTKAQKKNKKLEKQLVVREAISKGLGVSSPMSAGIYGAGQALKKKGKKKGGFWGMIGGAAKFAMDLAPIVAPLLLTQHAPTMAAAKALGSLGGSAASSGAPIAAPANCAACVGLYGMKAKNSASGRIESIRLRGMDYLGSLDAAGNATYNMGDVMSEIDLNPFSPAWNGTSLQRFASLFERYRPGRVCCIVEPACAATQPGQIISYIDPDPDDPLTQTGRTAIQIASTHEGADVSQVWGMNCAIYAFDQQTQDFYSDADGSDERLISPGTWRILANTLIEGGDATAALGSLYVVWEYTLKITQIEDFAAGGSWGGWTPSAVSQTTMFGPTASPVVLDVGNVVVSTSTTAVASESILYGLSPGLYVLVMICDSASTFTTPTFLATADGENYLNPVTPTDPNLPTLISTASTDKSQACFATYFRVSRGSQLPTEGFMTVGGATFGTNMDNAIFLFQVQDTVAMSRRRKKTLQSYEDDFDRMGEQVRALAGLVRQLASPTQPLSAAAATTNTGGYSSLQQDSILSALAQLQGPTHRMGGNQAAAK